MKLAKARQQLHVRAARLYRDDVGVHGGDLRQDVVELGIAHVGVDLRRVADDGRGDAEGARGPGQVSIPLAAAQRQAFADGRLVDLDDADAGRFQVGHLVADGQGDLQRRGGARLVVAHERPLQDRHRTRQHTLYRFMRQALRVHRPGHRHGGRALHVAIDDGRLDAARAVRLHPAVTREDKTVQLLAEVFDHVVAFRFAMHEHVQAQRFLAAHGVGDFGAHLLFVIGDGQFSPLETRAGGADGRRLREGADGRRREIGQLETRALQGLAQREAGIAAVHGGRQRLQALRHR
ncbi:hypothetical protein D3C81_1419540 [compost metagenome]